MLWFFLQKITLFRAHYCTSNTPQSPEGWEYRDIRFSKKSPVLLPLWGRGKIRHRQVKQIWSRFTESKALPLPASSGMLAEICQWLGELLLKAWGSCVLPPLDALAWRSWFSFLETGASALHQALLRDERHWHCWTEQACAFLSLYQIKLGLWSWNLYLFHYWFNKIFYQRAETVGYVTLKLINYLNRSWDWRSNF